MSRTKSKCIQSDPTAIVVGNSLKMFLILFRRRNKSENRKFASPDSEEFVRIWWVGPKMVQLSFKFRKTDQNAITSENLNEWLRFRSVFVFIGFAHCVTHFPLSCLTLKVHCRFLSWKAHAMWIVRVGRDDYQELFGLLSFSRRQFLLSDIQTDRYWSANSLHILRDRQLFPRSFKLSTDSNCRFGSFEPRIRKLIPLFGRWKATFNSKLEMTKAKTNQQRICDGCEAGGRNFILEMFCWCTRKQSFNQIWFFSFPSFCRCFRRARKSVRLGENLRQIETTLEA